MSGGFTVSMKIIHSNILSQFPEVIFGMSTRAENGPVNNGNMSFKVGDSAENVTANRRAFFHAVGIEESNVAYPLQEHTNNVTMCSEPGLYPHCDGVITSRKNLFLAISIADCTPIVLFDTKKRVIAGIHAGWRGTAKHIVVNALNAMREKYDAKTKDIVAFIGPSAGGCCYEVGEELLQYFPDSCSTPTKNGKYLLDVKKTNMIQLLEYGLKESHIEIHQDCTIHNAHYHSFRRDGTFSGRMLAVTGIKQ